MKTSKLGAKSVVAGNPPVTGGKPLRPVPPTGEVMARALAAPKRCPCYGVVPTAKAPLGTACKQPPVIGRPDGLCPYHAEMFDGIDRRSTLGLRRELAEDVPYGDSVADDDDDE